ncbi:MAG TPA: sulfurtransferase-like selenium metabolism protein YedF [Planktothrix sp.]|jgi:selenium metabolism protein YedF
MKKTVDLRGLVCPEPVLRAKKLLDDATIEKVEAFVETEINVNNLQRLARSLKLRFSSSIDGDCYRVTLERDSTNALNADTDQSKPDDTAQTAVSQPSDATVGTVVFLGKDRFGEGDPEFSRHLIDLFLQTLLQGGHKPRAILMANTGVKLMDPDATTVKVLNDFRDSGVEVLACGLCVDFYGLKGKIATEQITNMFAICEFLMVADKIIQP